MADLSMPAWPGDSDPYMDEALRRVRRTSPRPMIHTVIHSVDNPEPSDLAVAVRVAQRTLDSSSPVVLRESLRLVLRALDAEPQVTGSTVVADLPLFPSPSVILTEAGEDQ